MGTQVLTVSGRVSGVTEGTITVEILNDSTSVMQQQTAVENGRYRLTLLDLSVSTPALAQLSTTNRIEIGYQQGQLVETAAARLLLEAEIASGLVVQDFEIVLLPQIQVAPTLDFGRVYVGVVSQQQLQISNSGSAQLQISAISGGGGLNATADYPLTIAAAGDE